LFVSVDITAKFPEINGLEKDLNEEFRHPTQNSPPFCELVPQISSSALNCIRSVLHILNDSQKVILSNQKNQVPLST